MSDIIREIEAGQLKEKVDEFSVWKHSDIQEIT